ncbi:MAG: hypothetical protein ABID84_01290 [Chloroflexota bacterium]
METKGTWIDVFITCDTAIANGQLIHRVSRQDKEFHFQDWFQQRLDSLGLNYDLPARNTYPDFRLVNSPEGYEVKGLAYPGREASYDSNSQVPTGIHGGRTIYYLFGRYPSNVAEDDYPVIDMVLCHGDFLNADHTYVHRNKSIKGFGSYGDIMIRDRKMYVCPTPFAIATGTVGQRTLIVPAEFPIDSRLQAVGELRRVESDQLVVGYEFNLGSNTLLPQHVSNPDAGREHVFIAYRSAQGSPSRVTIRPTSTPRSNADE